MTRNLYVGADVGRLFSVSSLDQIPGVVSGIYQTIQDTRFSERAEALADEVARSQPALIGLQEVALLRRQSPGDFFRGNPVPATTVVQDNLQLLLSALAARGLIYVPVIVQENTDIELPSMNGDDLRLTDRDVILARSDVDVEATRGHHYATNRVINLGGLSFAIQRGWVEADVHFESGMMHFANTHLEPASTPALQVVQEAQASELILAMLAKHGPVSLVGDFNSAPGEGTYQLLASSGFADLWTLANDGAPGLTCCQAEGLRNVPSRLVERVDLLLLRGPMGHLGPWFREPYAADVVGDELGDRTPSGLWPSDHGGVAGGFRVSTGASGEM
ncbi:MAG TPA: endonuclease/exonuclease/phosphatase family protein [Myxococcaceae bacterium]|nr:endonuclease/exonuclease/phosphatase family protein [Myxococcaceae bacterium]